MSITFKVIKYGVTIFKLVILLLLFSLLSCGNKASTQPDNPTVPTLKLESGGAYGEIYYDVSSLSKGLILCFHGTGGSASGWSSNDKYSFISNLHQSGFAILCTTSLNRTTSQWDATNNSTNLDVVNIDALLNNLNIPSGTKIFLVGHSNGGGFTSRMATWSSRRNNIKAIQISNSPGIQAILVDNSYTFPTMFNFADCDPVVNAADVRSSINTLVTRSIALQQNDLDTNYSAGSFSNCHEFLNTAELSKQFFNSY
jgi:poly(3-hydroxybutyrate) depolymerase